MIRYIPFLLLFLVSCKNPNPQPLPSTVLRIGGSASFGEHLMPQLVLLFFTTKGYNLLHSSDTIFQAQRNDSLFLVKIIPNGTANGLEEFQKRTIELVMISEDMDSTVRNSQNLDEKRFLFIAKGQIAVIVHKYNPISTITFEQLRGIFEGNITDWATIPPTEYAGHINPHVRSEASGTTHTFRQFLKNVGRVGKKHRTNATLYEDIKRDFYGIGYIAQNELLDNRNVKQLKILNQHGQVQTLERPFFLYSKPDNKNHFLEEFTAFCTSQPAKAVAKSMGFETE